MQCFLFIQSEGPSESEMNNLGIYLLFSFSFVMAALVELFVLVILSGRLHGASGSENIVHPNGNSAKEGCRERNPVGMLISKIDKWAFWLFNLVFLLFNCGYWMKCLAN